MEQKHLLLVDLDGTIRQSKSGAKFINCPDDQEAIPKAVQALDEYKGKRFRIVGVTNQAGVHHGYKTLTDCVKEQFTTLHLFPQLDCIYFCPDLGNTCYKTFRLNHDCSSHHKYLMSSLIDNQQIIPGYNFRKPSPGMLLLAMFEKGRRLEECIYTGDRSEDREAARTLGMDFIEVENFWDVGKFARTNQEY